MPIDTIELINRNPDMQTILRSVTDVLSENKQISFNKIELMEKAFKGKFKWNKENLDNALDRLLNVEHIEKHVDDGTEYYSYAYTGEHHY